MKNIEKAWIDYARNWTKNKFGEYECLGCENWDSIEETNDYILRCIKNDYDHTMFKNYIVRKRTFSNIGMNEVEELIYLMNETGRQLFPDSPDRITSIIFDVYNINHGTQNVRKILNNFIRWSN